MRRRALRFLVMFMTMLGLMLALHVYIGSRLIVRGGLPPELAIPAWILLIGLFFSIPGGFYLRRRFEQNWTRWVLQLGYVWMGTFAVLLSLTALSDLARLGVWAGQGFPHDIPVGWDRMQAAGIALVAVPAVLLALWTARRPTVERKKVPISALPPSFEGFRIVQISDMHIGPSLDGTFMRRVVDQVNALKPDVVAVTGDLVDGHVTELREDVAPLSGLKASQGSFFVTGNHEYYHGADDWEAEVRRLGLTVLHNEHRVLQRGGDALVIAGVTDHNGGDFGEAHVSSPQAALSGAPTGAPRILLAHQPRSAKQAATAGVDLQLSGHTHGGQIFPWMIFVRLQQPVISGLKRLYGMWVYTNRGTGFWGPPMRLGPKPEISELTLVRA